MARLSFLVVVAAATLLAVGTPAMAAGPVHEWRSVDEAFTHDFCGFPIEERLTGTLHFITWFDPSGQRTHETVTAPGSRATWTNVVTGESVWSVTPYVVQKTENPDGSLTVTFTGLGFAVTGGGPPFVSSGRAVLRFSESGVELVAGAGPGADLCEALTAAIG